MRKEVLYSVIALSALAAAPAARADWSDNVLRYSYGPDYAEPGIRSDKIGKNILAFTHVDGYQTGGDFFNADVLKSDSKDPANNSSEGAVEIYVVYRHDFSLSGLSGKKVAFGPVRDVMIETGGDVNSKNTSFGPEKRMPVLGPAFAFDVPGFWNVAILGEKEWNNNGIVHKSVSFHPTPLFSTAWGIPFTLAGQSFSFEGFGVVNPPKGKDGFGNDTKTEILFHPKVMYDVGAMFGKPKFFDVGAGWEYWHNKFGADSHKNVGTEQSTLFVEADVHF